jgi:putative DNA primase/helicase
LTQDEVSIRVLGLSKNVDVATNSTIFATGNNLEIVGDLSRRSLLCSLDAGVKQPWPREFNVDVITEVRTKREELVVAALAILRAWHVARVGGREFELSRLVVSTIGRGGFESLCYGSVKPDPCVTIERVCARDWQRDCSDTVLLQWKAVLGVGGKYNVQDVINRVVNVPAFYTALLGVAANNSGALISNERFGRWLKRVEGKIVNGLTLTQLARTHGYPLWAVVQR